MTKEEIQRKINEANTLAMYDALEEFSRKVGAEMREQSHHLTIETARRYLRILEGTPPHAFGGYDRDDIARLLNADATVRCDGYVLDTSQDPEKAENWQDCANWTEWILNAEEAADRFAFIEAFEKYLHTAAAFAKSIGGTHPMRLYLRAWDIVRKAREQKGMAMSLTAKEALCTVNLERAATEWLWVDYEAARLPKFTPLRKTKKHGKPKSAKTRKERG